MDSNCDNEDLSYYDLPFHIGAIFILAAVGAFGILLPVLVYLLPQVQPGANILTFGNFFGAGIVISTAFIHVVPPAIEHLTNPCLGGIASEYPALALVIIMFSVLAMHLIEFVVARKIGAAVSNIEQKFGTTHDDENMHSEMQIATSTRVLDSDVKGAVGLEENQVPPEVYGMAPSRHFITVLIFEVGVAIHSIIIGISLGVVGEPEFTTLLIALAFHQLFEGFALGSAVTQMSPSTFVTIFTSVAYSLSAPLGITVGIVARSSFNKNTKTTLVLTGIFEAISAGTLIYTGLVELLTYGLTLNPQYSSGTATWKSMVAAFLGLYVGAIVMSIIGRWA